MSILNPEVELVDDLGAAADETEQALADARQTRDNAMWAIEASRHGILELSPEDYLQMKIVHGEARADARRLRDDLALCKRSHWNALSTEWMHEQADMQVRKCSLKQLWRLWRDVEAKRKAFDDAITIVPRAPREYYADDYGQDKFEVYAGTARQRAEAQAAMEEAEGLYDLVSRTFDGRQPRVDYTQDLKVKPPKRPLPYLGAKRPPGSNGKRKFVRSTYIGA